jgi:hypothetical protein
MRPFVALLAWVTLMCTSLCLPFIMFSVIHTLQARSMWCLPEMRGFGSCHTLLQRGALVNATAPSLPLFVAAQQGFSRICRLLIEYGADIDRNDPKSGCTALYVAAQEGHEEVACALLEAGASVGSVNRRGETPLFVASSEGHVDMCACVWYFMLLWLTVFVYIAGVGFCYSMGPM